MALIKQLKTQLEADREVLNAKLKDIEYLKIKIAEHEKAIKILSKEIKEENK